jgi:hypothetical protein
MKNYKIVLRLGDNKSQVIEIEAKNWQEVCDYVFGNIEIIDTEENKKRRKDKKEVKI